MTDWSAIPEGGRLIHIGPHKTGTTAIQAALWNARPAMLEQGVRYPGRSRNPSNPVRAVTGQPSPYSTDTPPSISHWNRLAGEIRSAHEPRVVVSSEFFAWATDEVARRIAEELEPEHLHVAVTLRPLVKILPSMWQQNVQAGRVVDFEKWLKGVLDPASGKPNQAFWQLERHDRLIERWTSILGKDHVIAIVIDERDHTFLLRVFEALLGLRTGTLALDPSLVNRSLTLPEAEAVRAFNKEFDAAHLPRAVHARIMRFGAAQTMKRREPPADEPRVELPAWARDKAVEIQREMVANIAASGATVIGDLERLTDAGGSVAPERAEPISIAPEIAASMAFGILKASGAAKQSRMKAGPDTAEPVDTVRLTSFELLGVLALRVRNLVTSRFRRR